MKRVIIIALLFLASGCGGDDPENCRFVRFIPERGESYIQYTCDRDPADVRYIPEAPALE